MDEHARLLTKSRFKQAVECPTKLYYSGRSEYQDNSLGDTFLQALAEGGYQVNALACLMYPGGVSVPRGTSAEQVARTRELLERECVTIYEAAFQADGLFARADILRKRGDAVEIFEVKAKSYDPEVDGCFLTKQRRIAGKFLPYLQDVAFQRHVIGLAYPQWKKISCFLVLADKSRQASVDGLNQRFKAFRNGNAIDVEVAAGTDADAIGTPILAAVPVDERVDEILGTRLRIGRERVTFGDAVRRYADAYARSERIGPFIGTACASCEFRTETVPGRDGKRSGFHECWTAALGWNERDFARGTVLDLHNFRGKERLLQKKIYSLKDVTDADLGVTGATRVGPLTSARRQWFQASNEWPEGGAFYFDRARFSAERSTWKYPLHFIDFETSTVAIPFTKGRRPYEQTAFQFSHHVLRENGRVEHCNDYLHDKPGESPNYAFLRALRDSLEVSDGTVFRWADHENTVLNQLRAQIAAEEHPPDDARALMDFTLLLTRHTVGRKTVKGRRCMVDLCAFAQALYFHPSTHGSSSIKKVLPSLMASSDFLKSEYSRPIYGGDGIPSRNFREPVAWWREQDGKPMDPYKILPPVFTDLTHEEQQALETDPHSDLREGGAATAAYARLQFADLSPQEREHIRNALLRYCELDTLAMVMTVQAWEHWAGQ